MATDYMTDLTPEELTTLARYVAGQCSSTESVRVAQWIGASPIRQAYVEYLRAERMAKGWLPDASRVDRLWQRLERRLSTPERDISEIATARPPSAAWRVAAGIALVAGLAGLWWVGADRWAVRPSPLAVAPDARVMTTRGERVNFRMPDGTDVILGPASTIRYTVAGDRGPRDVWLEGSAYFVVTHDAKRPFVVRTRYGNAEDLGTRFAVQAYASDSVIDVVVAEGEVALSATGDFATPAEESLVLAPGDRGWVTAGGTLRAERGIMVDRYLAWTGGRLEFEDTPLADVMIQIGRWYDLDIRITDSALGRRQLTASFRNQSAAQVLSSIAVSAGIRIEQDGKAVTLHAQ